MLVYYEGTTRHRYRLGTADPREAQRLAPAVYSALTKPKGTSVAELWAAYTADKLGRAVIVTMGYTWKALKDRFGAMSGAITVEGAAQGWNSGRDDPHRTRAPC